MFEHSTPRMVKIGNVSEVESEDRSDFYFKTLNGKN